MFFGGLIRDTETIVLPVRASNQALRASITCTAGQEGISSWISRRAEVALDSGVGDSLESREALSFRFSICEIKDVAVDMNWRYSAE